MLMYSFYIRMRHSQTERKKGFQKGKTFSANYVVVSLSATKNVKLNYLMKLTLNLEI